MKNSTRIVSAIFLLTGILASLAAQDLSPEEILKKADEVVNAPKDIHSFSKMILVDKDGNEKVRESEMYQKQGNKRLIRFLSPADQKGISILTLPGDVMYLYLPAFHKIRRIASHVKNENFAGTDFSYEDVSSFKMSEEYDPVRMESRDDLYILEVKPKPGVEKDYGKVIVYIRKDNFYPVKMEHFDKAGNLWKIMERRKIEKRGKYWISLEMEMRDLKKNHKTIAVTEKLELDTGIPDKVFTKRNLKKIR